MNLILLPGNDKKNKVWVDAVETELSSYFERTAIHYYDHWWSSEDGEIDLEIELDKLAATVEQFEKYVVLAKSAGVLLALYGIYEGVLDPEVCIFVGSAIPWGYERGFDLNNWLINYSIPTLFIQKTLDPALSFADLNTVIIDKNISGYLLKEIPGNDHFYEDIAQLKELVEGFVDLG
ncbi:MAG: hypothetical protein M3Q44_02570 [bacterium]|nr:hypothetical protein [bacterium]